MVLILGPIWMSGSIAEDTLKFFFFMSAFVESCGLSVLMSLLSLPIWLCAYNIIKIRENEQLNISSVCYHEMSSFYDFKILPV